MWPSSDTGSFWRWEDLRLHWEGTPDKRSSVCKEAGSSGAGVQASVADGGAGCRSLSSAPSASWLHPLLVSSGQNTRRAWTIHDKQLSAAPSSSGSEKPQRRRAHLGKLLSVHTRSRPLGSSGLSALMEENPSQPQLAGRFIWNT